MFAVFRLLLFVVLGVALWEGSPSPGCSPGPFPEEAGGAAGAGIDPRDETIFLAKLDLAQKQSDLTGQTLAVARSFLGTPYVTGTLNAPSPERLVINLRQLDCWTFMENSVAIALAARSEQPDYVVFQNFVQQLRYWGGTIDGYGSRIHYFSGWLLQAEKLGYLDDLTRELGGIPYQKTIGYMSARPAKYPPLSDPKAMRDVRATERRLNQHPWFYIPKNRVAEVEHLLQEGDIIALTSWKRDLDIAHQGFAVKKNGRIYLLHASSLGHRVVLSSQPLPEYMATQKGQTGIMVARLR